MRGIYEGLRAHICQQQGGVRLACLSIVHEHVDTGAPSVPPVATSIRQLTRM
jgi:hypothetical protein